MTIETIMKTKEIDAGAAAFFSSSFVKIFFFPLIFAWWKMSCGSGILVLFGVKKREAVNEPEGVNVAVERKRVNEFEGENKEVGKTFKDGEKEPEFVKIEDNEKRDESENFFDDVKLSDGENLFEREKVNDGLNASDGVNGNEFEKDEDEVKTFE